MSPRSRRAGGVAALQVARVYRDEVVEHNGDHRQCTKRVRNVVKSVMGDHFDL
ncbi:hypothetical protein FKP32DRAFT_22747 [Trametes sanguinea]|nr:hypothetical protein FKP32DRAFT_1599169 [Trametes sanguinea]KAI9070011.1 hypothetical protein FKP32DRAFT_22747 [Trametes sanguinea]